MQTSFVHSLLFVAVAGGCAGSGQFAYSAETTAPDLVVIGPNVQVIADLDEPIFYSGNYYWRNEGGLWYRSAYHTHGWTRVQVAPVEIRGIARPAAYVHYHGAARATVVEEHHAPPPEVRAPAPEVRDHRETHDDNRDERHDVKHEEKRDDKHDDKKHDGKKHD